MSERAFTSEFCTHAATHGGWPVEKCLRAFWHERNVAFMRNNAYSLIRQGHFAEEEHIRRVVVYLLDDAQRDTPERAALDLFLAGKGITDPGQATVSRVLERATLSRAVADEGFGIGMQILLWVFDAVMRPDKHLWLITDERRVREAAGWVCVECGRHMADDLTLPPLQALEVAEERMRTPLKEYQERIVAFWRRNPFSVMHAVEGNKVTGMCMAVPVTEAHYRKAAAGGCMSYDIPTAEILDVSPFVILEGFGIDPDLDRKGNGLGLSLVMAMICQQARVSDVPDLGSARTPLRVLAFTGTKPSAARLRKFRYRPLKTYMPGTRIEFMERTLAFRGQGFRDAAYMGIWRGVQLLMRDVYQDRPREDDLPGAEGGEAREGGVALDT